LRFEAPLRLSLLILYADLLKNCALHNYASKRPQSAQSSYRIAPETFDFSE